MSVFGIALMDESWETIIPRRLQQPAAYTERWSVGRVELQYELIDDWSAWKAAACGPLTLCLAALLREDATPIDAREIEPIHVPTGRFVTGFRVDFQVIETDGTIVGHVLS